MTKKIPFSEAFKDKTSRNPKVPKKSYQEFGDIPVIDQGKEFIAGFTSADNQMASTRLPVILFGDHTKTVKYVDQPFALGADGVKVLEPQPGFIPKYLYWALKDTCLPDAGYSRHFKFLKESSFAKPSIDEQLKIVQMRDLQQLIENKRERQQELFNEFKYSVFNKMFKSLEPNYTLEEACIKITDGTHQSPKWEDSGIPFLFVSNITSGEINFETKKFISEETLRNLTRNTAIEKGDILYSTVGSYGIPALVRTDQKFAFQRHIAHIKPNHSIVIPEFLAFQLSTENIRQTAKTKVKGVAQPTLNLKDLKEFNVIIPKISEQKKFLEMIIH
ncbi:restriction endonuclease subunit S [Rothia sp. P4278]|uniref:restriction endonuclease subunit S n=1 Tax=Rothia sp. P4278 TaxID=3402658 RepID=UPI003AEB7B99